MIHTQKGYVKPVFGKPVNKWAFHFSAIEFFYWASNAAANYKTVFLSAFGFDIVQVGVINSISSALSIVVTPIGGAIADRIRSSRRAFLMFLGLMVTISAGMLAARQFRPGYLLPLAVLTILLLVLLGPTTGLMDVTVMNGCDNVGIAYGKVRGIGSCGAIAAFILLALFVTDATIDRVFCILILCAIPCMFFVTRVRPVCDLPVKQEKTREPLHFEKLLRNPYFIVFLFFGSINNIAQTCIFLFLPYLIKAVGGSMIFLGFVQAYRVIFELPVLFSMERLNRSFSYRNMVILSSFLWGVTAVLSSVIRNFAGVLSISTLAGFASGLAVAGSGRFNLSLVPAELQSTAQTLMYGFQAIGGIIGSLFGGILIEMLGIFPFHRMIGVMNLSLAILYTLSFSVIKAVTKKDYRSYYTRT